MIRLVASLGLCLAVVGCAASHGKTELASLPPPERGALVTAGPRCAGGHCTCRSVDDYGRPTGDGSRDEGAVPEGLKRFELRTGRGFDTMSITVDDRGTLDKDVAHVDPSCAYLDLPPGRWPVRVRVEAKDPAQGIHPRVIVNEYGRKTGDWYSTFGFSCGAMQPCIKADMKDWFDRARTVDRGIFDKCGSTRVEGIRWSVEHSPEQTLEDLTLDFVLHVYKFEPRFRHGAATCKGLSGGKQAEEELTQ
jgi:hypothetical protein